jgi:hypothetical protein
MAIYPFKCTILALYRLLANDYYSQDEIVDYAVKNNITAVMIRKEENDPTMAHMGNGDTPQTYSFQRLHKALNEHRIPQYVHSTDTRAQNEFYRPMGVGVYTNGVFGY